MLKKLEEKITSIKKHANPKVVGVTMFVIFGITLLFGMNMANVYGREKQENTDINNRTIYEIITNVNNIDTLVTKLRITSSSEFNLSLIAKIMAEANAAKDNLSLLPVNQNSMRNVSKFLSQVIGFSEMLVTNGGSLEEDDRTNLEKINKVANNLNKTLQDIYTKINSGRIKWDEVEKVASKQLNKEKNELKLTGIEAIGDNLEDYEGLIYDGAFSSHITNNKPKGLSDKTVTVEQATEKVKQVVENMNTKEKYEIEEIKYNGEIKGNIVVYDFDVKLKDKEYNVDVQITKQDGKLILLLSDRKVEKNKIEINNAKELGDKYLQSLGLEQFEPTYYLTTDNMVTINYAAVQDNVILYPDLIKVKIALDTGEICSVECTGYIYNHIVREDVSPSITETEARNKLNKDIQIEYSGVAIIPLESKEEVLTYEFRGKVNDKEVLVYINAKTGKEENILLILETPGGILTM